MKKQDLDRAPMIEPLEERKLLSHTVFTTRLQLYAAPPSQAFGATMSFPVTAKLTQSGHPMRSATVYFVEDNTTAISQGVTSRSGYVYGIAPTFYTGKHTFNAYYLGAERYRRAISGSYTATITPPKVSLTTTSDGLEWATLKAGTGAAAAVGQTGTVDYIGYLATDGSIFDSSEQIGHSPIDFELFSGTPPNDGKNHAITGFNEGMIGMKVGEERVMVIPPAIGYGSTANGSIPANSTLIFIVKMVSISG